MIMAALTNDQCSELRRSVYQIADAYQELRKLAQVSGHPDVARLVKDLRDIADDGGSLYYFTQIL